MRNSRLYGSRKTPALPSHYRYDKSTILTAAMHLMYTEDPATGNRIYTLKKVLDGTVTKSAHPARFSPDDKYSRSVFVYVQCSFQAR